MFLAQVLFGVDVSCAKIGSDLLCPLIDQLFDLQDKALCQTPEVISSHSL
jgi:hypothetical protein